MADDDTAPAPDYHEAPYMMQRPDGSTETRVLHTDRPITHGELSDYVASQGGVYLGPPPPPSTTTTTTTAPPTTTTQWQPPPPLPPNATDLDRANRAWALGSYIPPEEAPPPRAAPPPAPPAAAPTVAPPSLMQAFGGYDLGGGAALSQAFAPPAAPEVPAGVRGVIAPERTFLSQTPSIIGATVGGRLGSYAATPYGPEAAIGAGMVGAGFGGGVGEGGQILYEKATGAPPAEPGSAWHRIANAALRSGTFEGLTAPLRALPIAVAQGARPAADAMAELEPELSGRATGPLADWWAKWSARPAEEMAKEWAGMESEKQAAIAGSKLPAMRAMMETVAKGVAPISRGESVAYGTTLAGVPGAVLAGHPGAALTALYPAARAYVREAAPTVMSTIARAAPDSPWLLSLPRTTQVAGALISPVVRGGAQTFGTQRWGSAQTTFPEPPGP